MEYQSPRRLVMVAQLPTSDWRDEQWVLGYGLFVNTLVYAYLRLFGRDEQADLLGEMMNRFDISGGLRHRHVHEGLVVPHKPYYALWSYKVHESERFDLLGNSLAILTGIASPTRAAQPDRLDRGRVRGLRERGDLALDLPPNFFPYIQREDPDWRTATRYTAGRASTTTAASGPSSAGSTSPPPSPPATRARRAEPATP